MEYKIEKHDQIVKLYHYDKHGEFTHAEEKLIRANSGLPASCTLEPIPEVRNGHKLYYTDKGWVQTQNFVGRPYWDADCVKYLIDAYPFRLPSGHTYDAPPAYEGGKVRILKDDAWVVEDDLTGTLAYAKNPTEHDDYYLESHTDLRDTHTLLERGPHDSWNGSGWTTDLQAKFEADTLLVQEQRRYLYMMHCDAKIMEAGRERRAGNEARAVELEAEADRLAEEIKLNNPLPVQP